MCHFSELAPELWFLFMGMNYLNIFVANLRAPEYVSSQPVARATWLNLLAYCVDQENGGAIENCANWTDRQWLTYCGVTKEEAETASPLVEIKDGNAKVWAYPDSQEAKAQKNRVSGSRGGLAKKAHALPHAVASATPHAVANLSERSSTCYENASTKGNGMEEKEIVRGMEAHEHCNPPKAIEWTAPTVDEFMEFHYPLLADLGKPLPSDEWLLQQYSYLAGEAWPAFKKRDWKVLQHAFIGQYRSRHAEMKAKMPPKKHKNPDTFDIF